MKRFAVIVALVTLVAITAALLLSCDSSSAESFIPVSGNIEITDAEVSFKLPGRLLERLVSEGERVKKGQVVARLDTSELVREVALREAEVEAARAKLAELEAGSRPQEIAQAQAAVNQARAYYQELVAGSRTQEIAAAEAAFRSAQAEANRLAADFERDRYLFDKGIISAQRYEATRTAFDTARERRRAADEELKLVREGPRKEQLEQAREKLKESEQRLSLVKEGPRAETIQQTRAQLRQAQESLALAETRLGYATLYAPLDGIVLSENLEAGEYLNAGTPVVTIGNLKDAWLRAFIDETDLGRVKLGQPVELRTDTFADKVYLGRVSFISSEAEFTPKHVQTEKERVKLVYRIKIDVENPQTELKPGMPADARILLRQEVAANVID